MTLHWALVPIRAASHGRKDDYARKGKAKNQVHHHGFKSLVISFQIWGCGVGGGMVYHGGIVVSVVASQYVAV